jgi:hypothetical protein
MNEMVFEVNEQSNSMQDELRRDHTQEITL